MGRASSGEVGAKLSQRPSLAVWFCGYVATPRCFKWSGGALASQYGYALWSALSRFYTGCCIWVFPTFLNINNRGGIKASPVRPFISAYWSGGALLAITVILWGYGYACSDAKRAGAKASNAGVLTILRNSGNAGVPL